MTPGSGWARAGRSDRRGFAAFRMLKAASEVVWELDPRTEVGALARRVVHQVRVTSLVT